MTSTIVTIQGLHTILAAMGGPHWLIGDEEARTYAQAVRGVMRHYPLDVAEKAQDWFNLCMVVATVEGKRYAIGKAKKNAPPPSPFGTPPPPGTPFFQYQPPPPPSRAASRPSEPFGPPNPAAGEPVH